MQRGTVLEFIFLSTLALHVTGGEVGEGYASPYIVIPYAQALPTIDGAIDDAEWQGALQLNALQGTDKSVSSRQAKFYLTWNEDNLFVAMRSPMRKDERPMQALRRTDKDVEVVYDDSYEIWVDAGATSPDGQPIYFQYLGNAAGARYDLMHEPAVGNMRLGWTAGWQPKNRIVNGVWEMEVAIPRTSIGKKDAFADGFGLKMLLVRNVKRPWDQVSFGGSGSFAVRDTHTRCLLSKTAPALHLNSVGDPKTQALGLSLNVASREKQDVSWTLASDGGPKAEGVLRAEAGKAAASGEMFTVKPGKGQYRVQVFSADKKLLLDWCAPKRFNDVAPLAQVLDDKGDAVDLTLEFNPVGNYLRVNGDFINYDARAGIHHTRVTVSGAGRELAAQDLTIDELAYVRGTLKVPDLLPGEYAARLVAVDAKGKEVLSREKKFSKKDPKEFAWWNTKLGDIEKVIAPWTPVKYADKTFDVWGRRMRMGMYGLPAQITSQGREFLRAPAQIELKTPDSSRLLEVLSTENVQENADHRRSVRVDSSLLQDLPVRTVATVEFDGMYKVDMTLTPKKAVSVNSLRVVVPLTAEVSDYIHATGEGIRYGYYYGFLARDKRGRIWDSRQVDSQPMMKGSFIPYLWIGDTKGGLCWFADSDEGWEPDDKTPAIEVIRNEDGSADLVLNLISAPCTLEKPRSITFAFQATPVKPNFSGWRQDPWWTGDTFKDFACVEDKGGHLIFTSLPFTLNTEKCKKMVEEKHGHNNTYIQGVDKYKQTAVPYFEHIAIGKQFAPEVEYFGDEWRTSVSRGLYYGKTFQDYVIDHLGKWARDTGIDGFYIDNVAPLADDNIDAGRGYKLPDGRIQPTYQMFETRKYFLRMRAAFAEQGKHNKIVLHMTNNLIIPWVGASDIAFDGEMNVLFPEMNKDFMDVWTLERLRSCVPSQWGCAVNFLQEYQGAWEPKKLKKAMRAYSGALIVHDVLATGNANGLNTELTIGRDRFGIENDDVRFTGYWERNAITADKKDVRVSSWSRPGKMLLAIANFGESTETVLKLDGLKVQTVIDAETQETLSLRSDGNLLLPVDRHDYRQIILESSTK